MDDQTTITLSFTGKDALEPMVVVNKSLFEIAKDIPIYRIDSPLLIHMASQGKSILYDDKLFLQYINSEINFTEIIDKLWCDALYRNNKKLLADDTEIDPGSLWLLRKDKLVLLDDDEYIEAESELIPDHYTLIG